MDKGGSPGSFFCFATEDASDGGGGAAHSMIRGGRHFQSRPPRAGREFACAAPPAPASACLPRSQTPAPAPPWRAWQPLPLRLQPVSAPPSPDPAAAATSPRRRAASCRRRRSAWQSTTWGWPWGDACVSERAGGVRGEGLEMRRAVRGGSDAAAKLQLLQLHAYSCCCSPRRRRDHQTGKRERKREGRWGKTADV